MQELSASEKIIYDLLYFLSRESFLMQKSECCRW